MWTILNSRINADTVDRIIQEAADHARLREDRHFVTAGKSFFGHRVLAPERAELLFAIHRDIAAQIPFRDLFEVPSIDHAYLLFKSPGAPATAVHQDRPFWVEKEPTPTQFTCWISLTRIDAHNGALTLNPASKVDPAEIGRFNTGGTLYPHRDFVYGADHSALAMETEHAERLAVAMIPTVAEAGEVIIFDGFEPHGSTDNTSTESRLALKIVYAEGRGRKDLMVSLDRLAELADSH